MKVLGILFLLIGVFVAWVGYDKTSADSYLGLQERIALNRIADARETLAIETVFVTGEVSELRKIRKKEDRDKVVEVIKAEGLETPEKGIVHIRAAERAIADAESKHRQAISDREESMKWHYVPAVCFAVLGLILLVVPNGTRRNSNQF